MPTVVFNYFHNVETEHNTMLLVIASKVVGSQTVLFDSELEVFVRAHEWRWNRTTQKPYAYLNGKRMELHRHLAEMAHRDRTIANVSIHPKSFCDFRMKNLLVRFTDDAVPNGHLHRF